ncbi:UpxY family transcription antiterminator [Luteibaculum oceani]|uniref:UpxY family transcription antiterminator n=1 Tax=Luteibaculum oceani TaxID=1294296 RepID=A0A5C6V809_9FLAO|nr:UpxY family transcription antiterminator [Luteibaculum oceani]TXC81423.1 UpxY family transcription antiterminator [Luteibaculum oceani]
MSNPSQNDNKQWMAVYVRSRNEKKVQLRLEMQGIEAYAPVQEVKRQWSDRVKKVKIPVIPSYVFVRTDERERQKILQDPAVMNFVFWLGKPAIIRDEEINRIKFILKEKDLDEEIKFEQLQAGDNVEIKSGAFSGEIAEVLEDRKSEVTVILKSLGVKLTVSKIVL